MKKVECPVCHKKVCPLPLMRNDTVTIKSKDGYFLEHYTSGATKGEVWDTCYRCGYAINKEVECRS